jgi:catechol 2,3-dioxygenase-like lactoylglutathione lyase family enzyme
MFTDINISTVFVLDQNEALDFYCGKLGFEVGDDIDLGFMRWLTVRLPSSPGRHLLLEVPGPPSVSPEVGAQVRDLVTKGAMGGVFLVTDDCRGDYERLKALGVEFTQEPTQQPYGLDCGLRDPFGNQLRFAELAPGPVEVSDADKRRWAGEGS